MSEEKSFSDKLMDRIQKQTMINAIKEFFKKYPKAKTFLPFLRDSLMTAKGEYEKYLGDSERIIVIGRKNGRTRLMVIDAQKEFAITTGLKIGLAPGALLVDKTLEDYLGEIAETGIFDLITKEDEEAFRTLQDKGIGLDTITDAFKKNESGPPEEVFETKLIESPAAEEQSNTETPNSQTENPNQP